MQTQFLKLISELTDNRFYVPTFNHSSGFNECQILNLDDEDFDIKSDKCVFIINEEGEEKELTFKEMMKEYPEFTLSRDFAFDGNFVTWADFKLALDGEIKIRLLEI